MARSKEWQEILDKRTPRVERLCREITQLNTDLKAAEARVLELAGALEKTTRALQETADWLADEPEPRMGTVHGIWNDASAARTVLTATSAEALERARAVENCISALRHYARNEVSQVVKDALAKLDALGKEEDRNDARGDD